VHSAVQMLLGAVPQGSTHHVARPLVVTALLLRSSMLHVDTPCCPLTLLLPLNIFPLALFGPHCLHKNDVNGLHMIIN
jgi:hypothetical protein